VNQLTPVQLAGPAYETKAVNGVTVATDNVPLEMVYA
jgi:hypothetical protein